MSETNTWVRETTSENFIAEHIDIDPNVRINLKFYQSGENRQAIFILEKGRGVRKETVLKQELYDNPSLEDARIKALTEVRDLYTHAATWNLNMANQVDIILQGA